MPKTDLNGETAYMRDLFPHFGGEFDDFCRNFIIFIGFHQGELELDSEFRIFFRNFVFLDNF